MSPVFQPAARCESIVLSRQTLVNILVHNMGWDDEDVQIFWRLANREAQDPGCLERERLHQMHTLNAVLRMR